MSAEIARNASSAAARRAALRRTAAIGVGLGVAALPVLQSTGASIASDGDSDQALLELGEDDEDVEELEDADEGTEFVDATQISGSEEIDGPGTYELLSEQDGIDEQVSDSTSEAALDADEVTADTEEEEDHDLDEDGGLTDEGLTDEGLTDEGLSEEAEAESTAPSSDARP